MSPISKIMVSGSITLKPLELTDTDEIFNTIDAQRDYLGKWLPFVRYTRSAKDTLSFVLSVLEQPVENGNYMYVIQYDEVFAGLIGFKDTDNINKKTEIGYWLSEKFQKKGIITESIRAMMKLAYNKLDIHRIQIKCAVGNTPSSNIPKRLGFRFEGIERAGELHSNGCFLDIEVYSKLKGE